MTTCSPQKVVDLLRDLYGSVTANELSRRIEQLAGEARAILVKARSRDTQELSENDALLITYADQVQEPGRLPLEVLDSFASRFLEDVVSGIHLLPFYPSTSDDGFAVSDYYAVDDAIGTWAEVQRIGRRFDLMLDGVFNHMSSQGYWFRQYLAGNSDFADFFVSVEGCPDLSMVTRPRALPLLTTFTSAAGEKQVWTTFSADQVDLNFRNPEVLMAILKVLVFYLAQGARFIRLDAIAFLWKEAGTCCLHLKETHRIVQLFRLFLDEVAPDAKLITETNVPHVENISYFGNGSDEAQLVYNFALPPLLLHTIGNGNSRILREWAENLKAPSAQTTFFNFLASHDGIGVNPVRGILPERDIEQLVKRSQSHGGLVSWKNMPDGSKAPYEMNINYYDALNKPEGADPVETQVNRFLCAHAIMFSLPGIPAIYFHSLFGSRGDYQGAEQSGIPRRINREKLRRSALEQELIAPGTVRNRVFTKISTALKARRCNKGFNPAGQTEVLDYGDQVFAVVRYPREGNEEVLCLHNVTGKPVKISLEGRAKYRDLLRRADLEVDGSVELGPWGCSWLSRNNV